MDEARHVCLAALVVLSRVGGYPRHLDGLREARWHPPVASSADDRLAARECGLRRADSLESVKEWLQSRILCRVASSTWLSSARAARGCALRCNSRARVCRSACCPRCSRRVRTRWLLKAASAPRSAT